MKKLLLMSEFINYCAIEELPTQKNNQYSPQADGDSIEAIEAIKMLD